MLSHFLLFLALFIASCEQCDLSFDVEVAKDSYTLIPKPDFGFNNYYDKIELRFHQPADLIETFWKTQDKKDYRKLVVRTCQVLGYNIVCSKDGEEIIAMGGRTAIPPTKRQIQVESYYNLPPFSSVNIKFRFNDERPDGNCEWQVCFDTKCQNFIQYLTGAKSYCEYFLSAFQLYSVRLECSW
ncbi:hypothetical protein Ciccas_006636 [Cichlidogyrus casuarinus]|uniref:Uncharacterized protein n=1 Tax=Cichlidogyrus casuarinus TaxID=1844966 RepID=A0ABD2Q568_9PLAT